MIAITRGIIPMNRVLRIESRNGGSIAVRIFRTVNRTMRIRENGIRTRLAIFLPSRSILAALKEDSPEVQKLPPQGGNAGKRVFSTTTGKSKSVRPEIKVLFLLFGFQKFRPRVFMIPR
jgi:hypothetical protein